MTHPKHLIVLSAPSGAGKTTVARHLLATFPQLSFSISATTRAQRPGEVHGKDYQFLSRETFRDAIAAGDLIEYEEIFGNYYGTMRSQIRAAMDAGKHIVFDVDVKGALSLQREFPNDTLLVFIAPPSIDVLRERLQNRDTETEEQVTMRLARAEMEIASKDAFDVVIVNDNLANTLSVAENAVRTFAGL